MIQIRKSADRGHASHGWLKTWHSFSFASYHDPEHMGFRSLRVINEDVVQPATGFGTHGHQDMEIVTYVLGGAVEHADSMGNGAIVRRGEVQRMTAGTGVRHSEMNPSATEPLHLLQIWIEPEELGLESGYEQREFSKDERNGRMRLVASRDGREGSLTIHQDVDLYATLMAAGSEQSFDVRPGRHAWIQVARGRLNVNGETLDEGDGAAISEETRLVLAAEEPAELLVFDLA